MLMLKSREIGAAEFKARCLELMEDVKRSGKEIVITKHRRPIARLVPVDAGKLGFCGSMKGMIRKAGDVTSPIDVQWSADEPNLA